MKISIITPVYKAEKFLRRCVESIIAQTYTNWELILIDDGSPDNSGLICDEYASKDHRVKVIHKKNEGVSAARQNGLDISTGEYVVHVDSDDWLSINMLERLVSHINDFGSDVVLYDFYRITEKEKLLIKQQPKSLNHIHVLKDIISGILYASCWCKIIKLSTIRKYKASFPSGINLGEDKCFLATLLRNQVSISYIPEALYFYDATINPSSLVRQITQESMQSGFAMVKFLEDELGEKYKNEISNIKVNLIVRAIKSKLYSDQEIRDLYKELNISCLISLLMMRNIRINFALLLYTIGLSRLSKQLLIK